MIHSSRSWKLLTRSMIGVAAGCMPISHGCGVAQAADGAQPEQGGG